MDHSNIRSVLSEALNGIEDDTLDYFEGIIAGDDDESSIREVEHQ